MTESIVCECGASLADSTPDADGVVTCENCGRGTKPTLEPGVESKAPTAYDYSLCADLKSRIRAAAAFVNQGKYIEALALYRWVHEEDIDHRDALYGMGFCYYKLGYFDRSKWLLERAVEKEHPSASKLLRKVIARLEPVLESAAQ